MVSLEKNKVYNKKTLEKNLGKITLPNNFQGEAWVEFDDDVMHFWDTNDTEFCCGLIELGNFYDELDKSTLELFKYVLKKATTEFKQSGFAFMATTIEDSSPDKAFRHFDDWVLTKSWVNKNSGNTLNLFILK